MKVYLDLAADVQVEDGEGVRRLQLIDKRMSYTQLVAPKWDDDNPEPTVEEVKAWRSKYVTAGGNPLTTTRKPNTSASSVWSGRSPPGTMSRV